MSPLLQSLTGLPQKGNNDLQDSTGFIAAGLIRIILKRNIIPH